MRPRLLFRLLILVWLLAGFRFAMAADDFLDPREAFVAKVQAIDAQTIEVNFTIAKGYYLYRDKFKFAADNLVIATPGFPQGKEKDDENFGKVEVYYDQVSIRLPVERNASGALTVNLKVTSQGCADGRMCYPAQHQQFSVELPAPSLASPMPTPQAFPADNKADESGRIFQALKKNGFWANIALFFLAGLGLALTPCVFPMIPILSGIIAGQGHRASHGRALALSIMYVLGMAVTYAIAGVIAGLTGTLISGLMQNAWVISAFAFLFVILAFSMFGFYQLQLPAALQSKLSEEAGHFANGRGPGVFIMGSLSALIVGPCVAAPLAGALLYIGKTGNAVLGGSALFALALGMGVPLIAVGLSAGTLLPRAGAWMQAVNRAFGVVLLGVALWLVSPLLPPAVVMVGWAALLIIPAVFLHALDGLPPTAKNGQRFTKGIGILLLLTGAAMLAGALAGSRNPWQPLAGLFGQPENTVAALPFERVASLAKLDSRLQKADKPVMLVFSAEWCTDCKRMERETFTDAGVRARLATFTLLKAEIGEGSDNDRQLLARFGLYGPPAIVFFDASGKENTNARLAGFQDAVALIKALDALKTSFASARG
ncbi:MAG: Protein-disulfide reductase [Proteobacteria bacterium]|nr:Protein-disulfide reductase [Pseudomonadota bacterium]